MSPSASSDHVVTVSLEPQLLGRTAEPLAVALPLKCYPRRWLMSAYAVFMAVLAALGLLLFASAVSLLMKGDWAVALAMLGLAAFSAVYFGGSALALAADAVRSGPSIIVGLDGLEDQRQRICLSWAEVARAEIRPSRVGIASLSIETRGSNLRSRKSFRIGAHRRRKDELVVPLQFLTPPPHVSALTMATLIERAGGEVLGKPFWARG